jgi:hypothetical protein
MKTKLVLLTSSILVLACNAAIAAYIPTIRPYTSYNNGGYKPSESSEYYKIKSTSSSTKKIAEESSVIDEPVDEPILTEVKNPKMIAARKAIKAIALEDRIKSNDNYTSVMNEYNSAREVWLDANSEMISQGLLQDPGDATYYQVKLSELEQCKIHQTEKNCEYRFLKVDGEHSQHELDDAASSREYLAKLSFNEFVKNFFILVSFGLLGGVTLAFLSSLAKK